MNVILNGQTVFLNDNLQISGASIISYLLEKSRISKLAAIERNYHIFYELLAGCSEEEQKRYCLQHPAERFHYLSQSECVAIPGVSDGQKFEGIKLAFMVLKMTPETMDGVFRTLSAILWLGNVSFAEDTTREIVHISDMETIMIISHLIGVEQSKLATVLTSRKITVRNDVTVVPLKPVQVCGNFGVYSITCDL
jgi:myosin-5